MVLQMIDYKITLTTDGKHAVEFFTYNEKDVNEFERGNRVNKIKNDNKTLTPSSGIRVFAPDDLDIIDVNEYGIFLGHKSYIEKKTTKEEWEEELKKFIS